MTIPTTLVDKGLEQDKPRQRWRGLLFIDNQTNVQEDHENDEDKYVYGIAGIAKLFLLI